MDDLISRKAVLELPRNRMRNSHGEIVAETISVADVEALPSAQPEPLTDKEKRIFLAAMGREREVCKQVDEEWCDCSEIERKVKGALWEGFLK